jgi:hypothetical protein
VLPTYITRTVDVASIKKSTDQRKRMKMKVFVDEGKEMAAEKFVNKRE